MLDATVALSRNTVKTDARALFPAQAHGLVYQAGDKRLIDGIDLEISAGSVTMVMGPNGAGKSLLLRLLHGLIEPCAGTVLWGGQRLTESLRKRQAMVFQRPVLMRRSVVANIQFVLQLRGAAKTERCRELPAACRFERACRPACTAVVRRGAAALGFGARPSSRA